MHTPTAFAWRDPATLPTRQFIYGWHVIRKYLTSLLAPGAAGKTSLTPVEALAICTGRPLLGIMPDEQCNVWLWNGEDPQEELERKVLAAMLHYRIPPEEVEGRLFIDSRRNQKIIVAAQVGSGVEVHFPVIDNLVQQMQDREIGYFNADPFLCTHRVPENNNSALDEAAAAWADVAERTNAAVGVNHIRARLDLNRKLQSRIAGAASRSRTPRAMSARSAE